MGRAKLPPCGASSPPRSSFGQKPGRPSSAEAAPADFVCPITLDYMRDPVRLVFPATSCADAPASGHRHAFERDALAAWLASHPRRDPLTNVTAPGRLRYESDSALRERIIAHKRDRCGDRSWRFRVGDGVDAKVVSGKWLAGAIVDIVDDPLASCAKVRVHFFGFAPKWDEWIDVDSARLARAGTHTGCCSGVSHHHHGGAHDGDGDSSTPRGPPEDEDDAVLSLGMTASAALPTLEDTELAEFTRQLSSTGIAFEKHCRTGKTHERFLFMNAEQGTVWWHNRERSVGGPDYSKLFFLKDVRAVRAPDDLVTSAVADDGTSSSNNNPRSFGAWRRDGNAGRAFSFVFPTRTLDGGCRSGRECRRLVAAFRVFVERAKARHSAAQRSGRAGVAETSAASWYNIVVNS